MSIGRTLWTIAWAAWLCPAISLASVTATLTARENNSLKLKGTWDKNSALINHQDCVDNISFTLTVAVSGENTSGRELYIFAGSGCNTSDDTEDCDDDIIKVSASTTTVKLPVQFIINADGCSDSDTSSIWVGLLEARDEKEDNATWASPIDIDFEGESLSAPKDVSAKAGENNLLLSWKAASDDNKPDGFLLVYAEADEPDGGDDPDAGAGGCEGPLRQGQDVTSALKWTHLSTGSSTSGRIEGLKNDVYYQVAVASLDEYANPSLLSEVACEAPGETVDFYELYRRMGGKAGVDYCFIATAAFGDIDHPTVRILRRFRDEVILKMPFGRVFVAAYYRVGPFLARSIHSERVFSLLRAGLTVFSGAALVFMSPRRFALPFFAVLLAVLLLDVLLLLRRRRPIP